MNVSVFGLGYVGSVTAACLARDGHSVVGVDTSPAKVAMVEDGRAPVLEPGLDTLMGQMVAAGRLRASGDAATAIVGSDISLVCVGTPSRGNGSLDLTYVERVASEIGAALARHEGRHTVVVRSTVLPGTVAERVVPILERTSGRQAGADFGVAFHPEFLREGSALADYERPSFVVIGELDDASGEAVAAITQGVDAPSIRTDLATAEMVKYASNAFHGLKVAFANEIGRVCKAHDIDGQTLMEIFSRDERLNVSAAYLRPGNAFGGSCLPKDTRALAYRATERDVQTPLLHALLASNEHHRRVGIEMVERHGRKRIGVLGLSFKPGTDDVRESPAVTLVESLLGRGHDVRVYDEQVELNRLVGANKTYLESELPHVASLMRPSLEAVLDESEVLVVTQGSPKFRDLATRLRSDQVLVDLVGIAKPRQEVEASYDGICW